MIIRDETIEEVMSEKISGLIITYNEEKNIREILDNLDFVDEIIVVDSFSTDRTAEIALQNPKTRVIQRKFENFTKQRNYALEESNNNWVLFLDADERITMKLKNEILLELSKTDTKSAFYFKRKFYYKRKPIHFSGTQNDKNFRLFRKDKCRYVNDKLVHETLVVEGDVAVLENNLIHYSFDNYDSYKSKMNHYAKLRGEEMFLKKKKYSPFLKWFKTIFKFLKSYVLKLGFLDGKSGFEVCYLQTRYIYKSYQELKNRHLNG